MITAMQAKELIDNSINNFQDGLPLDTIKTIVTSVNGELQLRDYLLGLPVDNGVEKSAEFVGYISSSIGAEDSYAFDTVNAMFQYELERTELALMLLEKVAMVEPTYSLAGLARRVISAEWPPSSFERMRNELHPKVLANLAEIGELNA